MSDIKIPVGAYTAFVTPFEETRKRIDWQVWEKLMGFQFSQGISGIVPAGTTGESATLNEREHCQIVASALFEKKPWFILAGCGSNSTSEAMSYVEHVVERGGKAVLLVDPYYNGPSSLEIRREYYEPIARAFPNMAIVPYIIPGRTGCKLWPDDLAILASEFPNVCAVKEATGSFDNMRKTRTLVPLGFQIFSGDDDKTLPMMTDPAVNACGVISVVSNIVPAAVQEMCQALLRKDQISAERLRIKLQPLFDIVTVSALRHANAAHVDDKFRNPLPIKTAMNALGMPVGPCRQPLGKMTLNGIHIVRKALSTVWKESPELLTPIQEFFDVDIEYRLTHNCIWDALCY
jgi:4-hydroxy-tetrahydrodipicolinate synthase